MSMDLVAHCSLPAADCPGAACGADLPRRRGAEDRIEMLLRHPDGMQEAVGVSPAAAGLVADLLAKASASAQVALLAGDAEIPPEDAAIPGISRPLVRRRMDAGELPLRRGGTHRRLRLADVLELKQREAPVRAALDKLQADTEDLLAHGL